MFEFRRSRGRPRSLDGRVGAVVASPGCGWTLAAIPLLALVGLIIELAVPGGIAGVIHWLGGPSGAAP